MAVRIAAAAISAAALVPAAAGAQDVCPNAPLRTGKQAQLPDCRAYEQVTPVDKHGSPVGGGLAALGNPDGDRFLSFSSGGIVPTESASQNRGFSSARAGDGWTTAATDPPQPGSSAGIATSQTTFVLSEDGSKALTISPFVLAPGAVEDNSNVYVRDLTRPAAYTLVASLPGLSFLDQPTIVDATPDLGTVIVAGAKDVQADVPDPTSVTYLFALSGGRVTLVSRLPGETAPTGAAQETFSPAQARNVVSDDGRIVTWQSYDQQERWFRTTLGGGTVEISRPRTSVSDVLVPAGTAFSSADGTTTTFGFQGALTPDSTIGSSAVYRATGDDLVDLTAPFTRGGRGDFFRVQDVSSDGRFVWFTGGRLSGRADDTVDPDDGEGARLFLLDVERGTVRRVARLDQIDGFGPATFRFSRDGQTVAFTALSPLTGVSSENPACTTDDSPLEGYCPQVFTASARTPDAPLACASCTTTGATAPARLTASIDLPGRQNRAVADDGRVFFDTAQSLAPGDTDASSDVYEYTPGVGAQLLTAGDSGVPAQFADVTPDGTSAFFITQQQLVQQDTDPLADVYVARTGGGIAAQRVAPAAADATACVGGCRPAPGPQPARPEQGSRALAPPAKVVVPRFTVRKPTARELRTLGRRGRIALAVRVTAPGTLSATLRDGRRTAAYATRRARRAQTVRIPLRLSKRARSTLRRSGTLKLRLTVRYSERLTPDRTTLTIKKGGAR